MSGRDGTLVEIVILVELVKAIVTLTIIVWDARINSLLIINIVKRKKIQNFGNLFLFSHFY